MLASFEKSMEEDEFEMENKLVKLGYRPWRGPSFRRPVLGLPRPGLTKKQIYYF